MTKEERIQEAYGEHWEIIKNYVDKDGWLDGKPCDNDLSRVYNNLFDDCDREFDTIRPKSLQGVENNNGWIKIEKEEDLPKEKGVFLIYHITGSSEIYSGNMNMSSLKNYTHYQLIKEPQPPIY